MATILEKCRVPAPSGAAAELSVPLTFHDIPWLHFLHPIRRLLFYDYPCSKPHFLETVAPKLKESLSFTLGHYLPVAGDLIFPLNSEKKAEIRYVAGDSAVSLTIAEFDSDFDDLIGNHARDADQFYEFVPQIDPVKDESEYQRVPVMALKVTLFPGRGICVGLANLHCLGDASSLVRFIQAWASINKLGGDEEFLTKQGQVSSFVVTVSYVWTCLVKSGEQVDDDVLEYFIFTANIRARIDPQVPANYFEAISDEIKNRVNKKDEVLKGAENWLSQIKEMTGIRSLGVSGSPKFDLSTADFGWGRARKLEVVSIDGEKHSISLCKSRDSEGGLEVGISLPAAQMEAFAAIFDNGIRFL
ncbi:UNVERIFIED_CONTAM: Malonyl-coenzyme:anthocyanin 5-O-glucoside-6'''-O-malonyltransferase [Sesamum radiatum]|uniref:Malonyl-coenzyme:anthocyanin 5-O-glucoside-6'''-O-malonyltransferase n=1 Tax=Sesamum radiatum TaxID=300843 RepID=A0AAW2KKK1_SESRA